MSSVNPTIVWDIVISRLFASASSSGLHWNVDPVGDKLVTGGAYRVVRQPVCPAMLIMCLGLAMGLRSWLGISLSVIVFLPSAVWRARLEEAALDCPIPDGC